MLLLQVYSREPLCSEGHAKETRNWIPVLKKLLLLWKRHRAIHEVIMQEQRLLISRRQEAPCLFSEGSRMSIGSMPPKRRWRECVMSESVDEWWLLTRTLGFSPMCSQAPPWETVGRLLWEPRLLVMFGMSKGTLVNKGIDRASSPH